MNVLCKTKIKTAKCKPTLNLILIVKDFKSGVLHNSTEIVALENAQGPGGTHYDWGYALDLTLGQG